MRSALPSAALCAFLCASSPFQAGMAQAPPGVPATERSVKAVYLYKFASYVEWPEQVRSARTPMTIGVLDAAEMADELARITADRQVNDRPVLVRRLTAGDSLAGLDVLFVGAAGQDQLEEILLPALAMPILIVTESAGALADGSIINFTIDRERVRFEVSLPAAERSRLKLSSRLLAVAQRVQRRPES